MEIYYAPLLPWMFDYDILDVSIETVLGTVI
jgi:hypothetical protein